MLVRHEFGGQDISPHLHSIDAETAQCFSPMDRQMIRGEITELHGSVARFTEELRLRFLLDPMGAVAPTRRKIQKPPQDRSSPLPLLDEPPRLNADSGKIETTHPHRRRDTPLT